jgi:cell division protein FtsN
MARGGFSRRRRPMSMKLIAIIAGVVIVLLIGALFWFAGQADSRRPVQQELSVPATNIGPNSQPAEAGGDAPAQ